MNRSLKLLLIINSIFVIAANMLGPLYAVFVKQIGGGILTVSATWSVMLLSTTLVNLVLIKYGDLIKEHEYFLVAGFLLRAIAWFGFIFSYDILSIIILQVFVGAGEAVGSTGFDTIFAEHLDKKCHIRDYAIWKTISNLIAVVATTIGGFIVATHGFTPLFIVMSSVALLCTFVTLALPRRVL